ncbi:lipase family protein [Dermatophilus congolensis]|uniref:lipase family protein n=1 Tax=Dermatophilus congolensis TaxID=1863 RepID=UPI001AB00734|nr:lipase [Dermatophilus congolensis]MBO3151155.1 lipase [Dermatophilus congolensis]MBO3161844.1 lipase [Dermatophilus congolensis]MBO3162438.1 lipase [Dermatophilus congolensis]MBO3175995.1 lipase [Dermatophilus congolensis]
MPAVRKLACTLLATTLVVAHANASSADEHDIPGTAGAKTVTGAAEPPRPAFYEPPASITGKPGSVIRSEAADTVADPLKVHDKNFTHRRVMYTTKDRQGHSIAATGLVIVPKARWVGPGKKRPLIVHAPGTQGTGDRCAASRQFQKFSQYEILFMKDLLLRGYAIAVPDYQGLGTPGTHTYMVRGAQAHAVLDMARAARSMELPGIDSSTPIGLNGYSQGGGAVAAAAELAPEYAPELDIKGVAAGAVPANLAAVAEKIDGGPYAAFGLYSALGLFSSYHLDPKKYVNDKGIDLLKKAEDHCTLELKTFKNLDTAKYTQTGKKLTSFFDTAPLKDVIEDNRIGRRTPKAPVLITHARGDDVIPYAVGKQLAKDWCSRGGDVQFRTHLDGMHALGAFPHAAAAQLWFEGRFAGKANQRSNCSSLK